LIGWSQPFGAFSPSANDALECWRTPRDYSRPNLARSIDAKERPSAFAHHNAPAAYVDERWRNPNPAGHGHGSSGFVRQGQRKFSNFDPWRLPTAASVLILHPSSRSRRSKATTQWLTAWCVAAPRKPMVGSFPDCCARAASGHAAAPLSSVMNARPLTRSPRRRAADFHFESASLRSPASTRLQHIELARSSQRGAER
jgi:hypothetical protein